MAQKVLRGDSPAIAKVMNISPVAPVSGTYTVWCNGKGVSYTAQTGDGVTGVVNGLATALQASQLPEFQEFLATANGNTLTLSATTAGVPFDIAVTCSAYVTVVETTQGVGPTNEVHEIQLLGTYTGGTFTLTYNFGSGNVTTSAIAYNASASAVQTALAALSGVGAGNVEVTGGPGPGTPWFVSWIGSLAGTAVTPGTVNGGSLTGSGSVTITTQQPGAPATDCLQKLQIVGATSGSFTLTFEGQTTSSITLGASAATIQSDLQALSSIGSGNVTVVGEGATGTNNSNQYWIHFTGSLAGTSLPAITVGGALAGLASCQIMQQGAASSQAAWQFVDLTGGIAVNGSFTLTFNGHTTAPISTMPGGPGYVSLAVQSALQAIGCPVAAVYGADALTGVACTIFGVSITSYSPQAAPVLTATMSGQSPTITVLSNGLASQDDIQNIWVAASGGNFTLTEGAQTTSNIAYNASTSTLQTRIQTDLSSTITACTVSGSGTQSSPWVVTITNPANTVVAQMTGNPAGLSGGGSVTEVTHGQAGTNEVQTITETAGVSGGTFTLSFEGPTTPPLAWNASSAQIQAALRALSTINTVTVSGSAGGHYTVTWSGSQGSAQQPLIVADGSQLTGPTSGPVTLSTATRSAGPLHWDDPNNWLPAGVPNSGDDVYFTQGTGSVLYGLNQIAVVTANASTDTVTWALLPGASQGNGAWAGRFQPNQIVEFTNAGGGLPGGVSAATPYYLVNVNIDAGTAQLATAAGGTPIDITTAGTGTHTMGVRLDYLEFDSLWSGSLGLPLSNQGQSGTPYVEYRERYLHIGILASGTQKILIGQGNGSGSPKIQIDTDVDQVAIKQVASGGSTDTGIPAVLWKGSNAASTAEIIAGYFGCAAFPGDVAKLALLKQRGGTVTLGAGTTVTGPIDKTGGQITINGATINGVVVSN